MGNQAVQRLLQARGSGSTVVQRKPSRDQGGVREATVEVRWSSDPQELYHRLMQALIRSPVFRGVDSSAFRSSSDREPGLLAKTEDFHFRFATSHLGIKNGARIKVKVSASLDTGGGGLLGIRVASSEPATSAPKVLAEPEVQEPAVHRTIPKPSETPPERVQRETRETAGLTASRLVRAHKAGCMGLSTRLEFDGKSLPFPGFQNHDCAGPPPPGWPALTYGKALAVTSEILEDFVFFGPGILDVSFVFEGGDVAVLHKNPQPYPTKAQAAPQENRAVTDECNPSDSNYGRCLAEVRERNYKLGIQAAEEVFKAYYDPFSGGPPGANPSILLKIERMRKIRQAGPITRRRHSGYGVPYRIIGPHDKLSGTSVYILKDADGAVLYVGKGEALNRLREHIKDPKKTQWFGEISRLEVRATSLTNSQALALEENLISQLKPMYNVDRRPFYKEFGDRMAMAPNLPAAQKPLHFWLEWGH
jgi:hypothetical protein